MNSDNLEELDLGNGGNMTAELPEPDRDQMIREAIAFACTEHPFCAPHWKDITPEQFRNRGNNLKTLAAILAGYGAR